MSRHDRDISFRTRAEIAAGTTLVTALGALLIFGGENTAPESGQPQRNPETPVGHVGQLQEHHPLSFYMSGKGPDGKIDFYAHKFTEHGETSYELDGGTTALATDGPKPHVSIVGQIHVGGPIEKPNWAK
jgi:hypothetical protein